jgi:putative endonuclease
MMSLIKGDAMFYVYVLESIEDSEIHYLGYSANLKNRVSSHNEGKNQSTKHTKWKIIYYEAYENEALARKREASLKKNPNMRKLLMRRIKD